MLTIVGIPRLHQQAFTDLIWVLMLRYGTAPAAPGELPPSSTSTTTPLQGAHP